MFVCAENQLLEDEFNYVHTKLRQAKETIKAIIESEPLNSKEVLREVITKLLTAPVSDLISAGGSTDKNGIIYSHYIESSRLRRIEWAVNFLPQVRQGQVVLQWHKYHCNIKKWRQYVEPSNYLKSEDSETPYWAVTYTNLAWNVCDLLTLEKVLWTLNWYEERREGSGQIDRVMVGFAEMFKRY